MAEGGAALGKGAWDCDNNRLIPPEKEVRPLRRRPLCRLRSEARASVNGAPWVRPVP